MGWGWKTFRVGFLLALLVGICAYFWIFSRYPDLHNKAEHALGKIDRFSIRAAFAVDPQSPFLEQNFYITLNWIDANKKGMLFGLVIASLLTAIFTLTSESGRGGWRTGTLWGGIASGTILGLCANCSAPIMLTVAERRSLQFALGLMFASPMFNPIVVVMSWGLFPAYLFAVKMVASVIFVFAIVPALLRWFAPGSPINSAEPTRHAEHAKTLSVELNSSGVRRLLQELTTVFFVLMKSTCHVWVRTVPLMLFAGFFGALLVQVVDFSRIQEGPLNLIGFNLAASLLPLPIAFDVIFAKSLYDNGLPPAMTAGLLFSGGVFSIYPLTLIFRYISRKLGIALLLSVVALSTMSSYAAEWMYNHVYLDFNITRFVDAPRTEPKEAVTTAEPLLARQPKAATVAFVRDNANLRLKAIAFTERNGAAHGFTSLEGAELGIARGFEPDMDDLHEPFWSGRGTASGDFNNDGWIDLVLGSSRGPRLYMNTGGSFQAVPLGAYSLAELDVFAVAFVDINNDSLLDLFVTAMGGKNLVLFNDGHLFQKAKLKQLPSRPESLITLSSAFYDIDGNGLLDWVNGAFSFGYPLFYYKKTPPLKVQRNSVVYNFGGRYTLEDLPGKSGETLSTLFSRMSPGEVNLYVANDYDAPDLIYRVRDGKLKLLSKGEHHFGDSPWNTMSVDTADLNNDTILDSFIAASVESASPLDLTRYRVSHCERIRTSADRVRCLELTADVDSRDSFFDSRKKADFLHCLHKKGLAYSRCVNFNAFLLAYTENKPEVCAKITEISASLRRYCAALFEAHEFDPDSGTSGISDEFQSTHHLYLSQDGHLTNVRRRSGSDKEMFGIPLKTGWTWTAKMADLDNDGFQDIYMANGSPLGKSGGGYFLRNDGGKGFVVSQKQFGLEDPFDHHSYTYIDYDNDGDLDIVANSFQGPVRVFRNDSILNAIEVEVRDFKGNRFGIGSLIEIDYGSGLKQVRELKAGGGYLSFDSPRAHFGLNDHDEIAALKILTADGRVYAVNGPLSANHLYTVELR